MKRSIIFMCVFINFGIINTLYSQEAFTQKDRELLIEIKSKVEANEKRITELREDMNWRFEQVDKRFEEMNRRFEQMFNFFQVMIGALVAILIAIFGFAYWDRRTIVHKARDETIAYIERDGRVRDIIYVLREWAQKDKNLEQIMKAHHLL